MSSVDVLELGRPVTRVVRWPDGWVYLAAVEPDGSQPMTVAFHDLLLLDPGLAKLSLRRAQVAIRAARAGTVGPWAVLGPYNSRIVAQMLDDGTLDRKQDGMLRDLPEDGDPGSWPDPEVWSLRDVVAWNVQHPRTYPVPEDTSGVAPGTLVKLVFLPDEGIGERMWVLVTEVDGDRLVGVLDNDPAAIVGLLAGDRVEFERRHVLDLDTRPRG
ncbi:DUF2314 domain-containing protein [Oerskovia sp. NPDC057915]|uniref:DUF2314 domain-containing protein n=1 Tax=Oerskovia sp. NPDC057915 TaxID=3346280 RepID=UPI0036DBBA5E